MPCADLKIRRSTHAIGCMEEYDTKHFSPSPEILRLIRCRLARHDNIVSENVPCQRALEQDWHWGSRIKRADYKYHGKGMSYRGQLIMVSSHVGQRRPAEVGGTNVTFCPPAAEVGTNPEAQIYPPADKTRRVRLNICNPLSEDPERRFSETLGMSTSPSRPEGHLSQLIGLCSWRIGSAAGFKAATHIQLPHKNTKAPKARN